MKLNHKLVGIAASMVFASGASSVFATEVDVNASSPAGTTISLGAGVYDVSEIAGTYVSANLWDDGAGVAGEVSGCATPSTCGVGFRPTFDISVNGGPSTGYSIPVSQGAYPATYQTAADALTAFQAYQTSNPISFSLSAPSTVTFAVPDTWYFDNTGGVSLSVVSAAPEPAEWMLSIAGIAGIGVCLRRKRKGERLNALVAS